MATVTRLDCYLNILTDLGVSITAGSAVLDFGCGSGQLVKHGRSKGYDFFGCDLSLRDDNQAGNPNLIADGILRQIDRQSYRLPFDDCSFDVVISNQVLEHVMDYPGTLAEIRRILKPDGVFLHMFPSRYQLIEPHVFVPLATMVRARWWLHSWALVGVRNRFQRQLSASATSTANLTYLTTHTNYLPKQALQRLFSDHFIEVQFVERLFLKHSKRGHKVYKLSAWLPFLPTIYSTLVSRVVFGKRGRQASQLENAPGSP